MNRRAITTKRQARIDFVTATFEPVRRLWKHVDEEDEGLPSASTVHREARVAALAFTREKNTRGPVDDKASRILASFVTPNQQSAFEFHSNSFEKVYNRVSNYLNFA